MDETIFLIKPEDCTEHSFTDVARFFNGASAWGERICQKCGTVWSWQYDLPNVPCGFGEVRAY